MNWRLKSRIQNAAALLPPSFSYAAYYWMQRRFGGLRRVDPITGFRKSLDACQRLDQVGASPVGGAFLEIGTGRHVNTPLAWWLFGARSITTVDLNLYLKEELVRESLDYVRRNTDKVRELLGPRVHEDRLSILVDFTKGSWCLAELLEFCGIRYIAPGNACNLDLPPATYDFHMSFNVFEHIPPQTLRAILHEGDRLLKSAGVFVHRIDYSDHFSHTDKSICAINFLQFSAEEWHRIAGNRYMYMNRMRVDDFIELFQDMRHEILLSDSHEDPVVEAILRRGELKLDSAFSGKPQKVLATTGSWFLTRRATQAN